MTLSRDRIVLVVFSALMLSGLLLRPLFPIDETRYVSVAWEMWLNGDFFVPTKNFAIYSHKPPLLFWLINLVWAMTGVTEFAARLIGPACGVASVALTGMLARRLWPDDDIAGRRAMLALSGMSFFAVFAGLTMFDALLAACVVAAMIALLNAACTGKHLWWGVLGVCLGAGVLAKGPVMLFHVVPAALAVPFWFRFNESSRALPFRRVLIGVGLALLVAAALVSMWLIPALVKGGPDYREAVLWGQTAGRVVQSFAHARPWWFYAACLPGILFPWIWLPSLWRSVRCADWRETGLRLALVWGGSAFILFSLTSGKQVHYLVPELPAVALIVGRLLRRPKAGDLKLALLIPAIFVFVLLALVFDLVPETRIGPLLEPQFALLPSAFALVVVCWVAWRHSGLVGSAMLGMGLMLVANLIIGTTQLRTIYNADPIASIIAPAENDGIAFLGGYDAQFNFAGRLTRPVAELKRAEAPSKWMAAHPTGLLVGELNRGPEGWPPQETIWFNGRPYGIWAVLEAPKGDMQP